MGVIEWPYKDHPDLGGSNYSLYLKVERAPVPEQDWWKPWHKFLYFNLLGRELYNIQQWEIDGINQKFADGKTEQVIAKEFLSSTEYARPKANWFYSDLLGRPPSEGELASRQHDLEEWALGRYSFQYNVIQVCSSPEFIGYHPTPEDFVRTMFSKVVYNFGLGEDKINEYISHLNQGMSHRDLVTMFTRSNEFANEKIEEYKKRFINQDVSFWQNDFIQGVIDGRSIQDIMIDIVCKKESKDHAKTHF